MAKVSKSAYRRAKKKEQKAATVLRRRSSSAAADRGQKAEANEKVETNGKAPPQADAEPAPPVQPPDAEMEDAEMADEGASALSMAFAAGIDLDDPKFADFKQIFTKFDSFTAPAAAASEPAPVVFNNMDDIPDEDEGFDEPKKAKKSRAKMPVAELKALVSRPELVEWTDVNSPDPLLHVWLKSQKNTVPVPAHWSLKREYLSAKRGIQKPPFVLPKFIAETGIAEMRDAVLEREANQTMRQKQRDRVQGRMGKLDIDYEKLFDAFFRRQTKPKLTNFGDVYYEGKEFETDVKHLRAGEMSDELRDVLAIPPGAPPPWLINQQRFGPPPSYPGLRIPGLNAPLPHGAAWGFQPGQWGKPPLNEFNQPLWGDIFGLEPAQQQSRATQAGEPVERSLWGQLRVEGESEDEESEEEVVDEDEDEDAVEELDEAPATGAQEPAAGAPSAAPAETAPTESVSGEFTLRKQRNPETREGGRSAYTVLAEHDVAAQGFMGSERVYDVAGAAKKDMAIGDERGRKRKADDVDVSVDVDVLTKKGKLDPEELEKQYAAQRKADKYGNWQSVGDDVLSMISEEKKKKK